MTTPPRTLLLLAASSLLLAAGGCAKRREAESRRQSTERQEPAAAREEPARNKPASELQQIAKAEIARKSEVIWEQSTRNKLADHLSDSGGGNLSVGEKTLQLTALRLRLGPLKTPGDLHGGQAPSELSGESRGPARLVIGGVALAAATGPEQIPGQTHEIAGDSSQIVMPDGLKWRFLGGGINFLRSEGSNVHLFIEGRAVPADQTSSPPVRVSGELVAHVELLPARGAAEPPKP